MKILFTTDTLQRGGKERQMFLLSYWLGRRGHCIKIITLKLPEDSFITEYDIKIDQIMLISSKSKFSRFIEYKEAVKTTKPDLVFSWDFETSVYNLILNQILNYCFINGSIQHGIRLFRYSHLIRSIACRISPFVVANSVSGLRANKLKPGGKRFVLYNGIEDKFIKNISDSKIVSLRKELIIGYSKNPGIVYISVANFVPYKDYYTVFKALSRLRTDRNFYYLIVGDGPMRSEVEDMIREFDLGENVILVGRTENVRDYLFTSDLMIHSSRGEGISNAILEGMHAGLPVIATNVGGIPETVFKGSSMLFPYKDQEGLYNCLLKAPELIANFDPSSEEYQAHLKKFSVETMVKRFEEIIDIVTKEKN